jgi:hypothetical protein
VRTEHGFTHQELANGRVVTRCHAAAIYVMVMTVMSAEVWTMGTNRFACPCPLYDARLETEEDRHTRNQLIHGRDFALWCKHLISL